MEYQEIERRGPDLTHHQVILRPQSLKKARIKRRIAMLIHSEVNQWATKTQVKAAIEEMFGVRVIKVRTQMRVGKKRRFRFRVGQLSSWKRAIVTLHENDKIEFF